MDNYWTKECEKIKSSLTGDRLDFAERIEEEMSHKMYNLFCVLRDQHEQRQVHADMIRLMENLNDYILSSAQKLQDKEMRELHAEDLNFLMTQRKRKLDAKREARKENRRRYMENKRKKNMEKNND